VSSGHLPTTASAEGCWLPGSSGAAGPHRLVQLHEEVLQEVSGGEALLHHHEVGFFQVPIHGQGVITLV